MSSDLAPPSPSTSSDRSDCSFFGGSDIEGALPPDEVFVEDVDAHIDHFWKQTRAALTKDCSLKYRVAKVNRCWKELAEGLASLFNERGMEWDSTSFKAQKFYRERWFDRKKSSKLSTLFKKSKWRNCHTTSLIHGHHGLKRDLKVALLLKDLKQDLRNEVAAIASSETTERERRAISASEQAETTLSCQSSHASHAATSTRSSSMKPEPKEFIVACSKHSEDISSVVSSPTSFAAQFATSQSDAGHTSVLSGSEQSWSLETKPQAEVDPSVTSSVLSDISDYTFHALGAVMGE